MNDLPSFPKPVNFDFMGLEVVPNGGKYVCK